MSKALKIISVAWLIICIFLAVSGTSQSHGSNPEGGIVPAILITTLTMPLGLVAELTLQGVASLIWGPNLNISYVGGILIYSAMIGLGYWQWFVLLPKLVRRMKHERSPKVWGLVLIGLLAILYGLYRFYIHAFPNNL